MTSKKMKLYEQRDFGEKINATFTFLRENAAPLGKSLLYIAGPAVLLVGIVSALSASDLFFNSGELSEQDILTSVGGSGIAGLLSLLSVPLVIGVVYSYFAIYFEQDAYQAIEVSDVWEKVKANYLGLLLSSIMTSVLVVIGFIFLIVPGFMLLAALSFIFILQVKERLDFGMAFSRCFKLVSDHYLSTLGLLLIMIVLQSIVTSVFNLPLIIFTGAGAFLSSSGEFNMESNSALVQALFVVFQVVSTLGAQFLYVITLVAVAFQYGNLVEKKEAAGLMNEIDRLGEEKHSDSGEEQY